MLTFWIICILMVMLALWFVLPALLQRSEKKNPDELRTANILIYQDQLQELESDLKSGLISQELHQQDKEELERRLLEDVETAKNSPSNSKIGTRNLVYGVALVIPAAAIAFYLVVGNPNAINGKAGSTAAANAPFAGQQGDMTQSQIEANVAKLAERLKANPNDAQGWTMLARSYMFLNRYSDAATAYARATALNENDSTLWADYAEALAMVNDQRMAGKPLEAANRALKLDPKSERALVLVGTAAFEAGDYQKAIDYYQRLLELLPPGSGDAKSVSDQIAKAKELAAGRGTR